MFDTAVWPHIAKFVAGTQCKSVGVCTVHVCKKERKRGKKENGVTI